MLRYLHQIHIHFHLHLTASASCMPFVSYPSDFISTFVFRQALHCASFSRLTFGRALHRPLHPLHVHLRLQTGSALRILFTSILFGRALQRLLHLLHVQHHIRTGSALCILFTSTSSDRLSPPQHDHFRIRTSITDFLCDFLKDRLCGFYHTLFISIFTNTACSASQTRSRLPLQVGLPSYWDELRITHPLHVLFFGLAPRLLPHLFRVLFVIRRSLPLASPPYLSLQKRALHFFAPHLASISSIEHITLSLRMGSAFHRNPFLVHTFPASRIASEYTLRMGSAPVRTPPHVYILNHTPASSLWNGFAHHRDPLCIPISCLLRNFFYRRVLQLVAPHFTSRFSLVYICFASLKGQHRIAAHFVLVTRLRMGSALRRNPFHAYIFT